MGEQCVVHGLTKKEISKWNDDELIILPLKLTVAWCVLRLVIRACSPTLSDVEPVFQEQFSATIISSIHAAGAVAFGAYFIWGGELDRLKDADRLFGQSEIFDISSLFGISYFLYDYLWMLYKSFKYNNPLSEQIGITFHHLLFIVAFWICKSFPSIIAMIAYSHFQLTELSTVFLNNHYIFLKTHVAGLFFKLNGLFLLATFALRVGINGYLSHLVLDWVFLNGLGSDYIKSQNYLPLAFLPMSRGAIEDTPGCLLTGKQQVIDISELPESASSVWFIYIFVFGCGPPMMFVLNTYWFVKLIQKANNSKSQTSNPYLVRKSSSTISVQEGPIFRKSQHDKSD